MTLSFLIEMAWKSTLVAGLALLLVRLLRSSPAADRAALLRLAAALLVALPLISLLVPALDVEVAAFEAPSPVAAAVAAPVAPVSAAVLDAAPSMPAAAVAADGFWSDPARLILWLYLAGAAAALARLAVGLWTLQRWTASAAPVTCPHWLAVLGRIARRSARARDVRLLVAEQAPSPLSWGWRSTVILVDPDALRRPDEAAAILEHEMAHVKRGDWPALILVRLATILFWFNPLVLLLKRCFVQMSEEAADGLAAARVGPIDYAQMLLGYARYPGPRVPANNIASTGLTRRVEAVLGGKLGNGAGSGAARLAATIGCIGFAVPVCALQLSQASPPAGPATLAVPMPVAITPIAAAQEPDTYRQRVLPGERGQHGRAARHKEFVRDLDADIAAGLAAAEAELAAEEAGLAAEEAAALADGGVAEAAFGLRIARAALSEVRRSMSSGMIRESMRTGMDAGARGMERGARELADQARRLRSSRAYRDRIISERAADGRVVTHEELIEGADEMEEGAREMREGAREMRAEADELRRGS